MASILLPAIFGAIFYNHLPKPLKFLAAFIFTGVLFEGVGYVCFLLKVNNMPLFHLHTLVELGFWTLIFREILRSISTKVLPVLFFFGFVIYMLVDLTFLTSLFEPNAVGKTIESILIIILCLTFISQTIRGDDYTQQRRRTYFTLTIGLLIFFLGTVTVSFYSDRLLENELFTAWTIRSVLNIILNITYTVVIWSSVGLKRSD